MQLSTSTSTHPLKASSLLSLFLFSLTRFATPISANTHAIGNGIQLSVYPLSNAQTCTPSTITWGYELTNGAGASLQTDSTISLYILDTTSAGLTSQKKRHLNQNDPKMVKRRNRESEGHHHHHQSILKNRQLSASTVYRKLPNSDSVSVMNGMFSWSSVDVPSGSYVLLARLDGVDPPTAISRSDPFYIRKGQDVSCVRTDDVGESDQTSSTYGYGSGDDDSSSNDGVVSSSVSNDGAAASPSSTAVDSSIPSSSVSIASSTPSSSPSVSDNGDSEDEQDASASSSSSSQPHQKGISGGGIAAAIIVPILVTIAAAYYFYRREKSNKSSNGGVSRSTFQHLKNHFGGNGGGDGVVGGMMKEKESSESNEKSRENWTEFSGEDLTGPRSLTINRNSVSNDFSDIMIENPPKVYQQPNRHLSALQEEDEFGSIHRSSSNQDSGLNYLSTRFAGGNQKQHDSFAPSTLAPSTLDGQIGAPYGYGAVVDKELDGRRWSDPGEEVPIPKDDGNGNGNGIQDENANAGGLQRSLSTSSNFSIKRKPVPVSGLVPSSSSSSSPSAPSSSSLINNNPGFPIPPQRLEILDTSLSNQKEQEEGNDTLSPLDTSFNSTTSSNDTNSNQRSTKFQSTWSSSTVNPTDESRLSDSQISITSSMARRERDEAFAEAYGEAVEEIQKGLQNSASPLGSESQSHGEAKNPFDDENQVNPSQSVLKTPSTPKVLLPSSPSLTATPDASNLYHLRSSPSNSIDKRSFLDNGLKGKVGNDPTPPTLDVDLGDDKGFRISFS